MSRILQNIRGVQHALPGLVGGCTRTRLGTEEAEMHRFIGIDVGASPGGWTQFLAQYMYTYGNGSGVDSGSDNDSDSVTEVYSAASVLAIDPGDLKQEVLDLENVIHVHCAGNRDAGIHFSHSRFRYGSETVRIGFYGCV